VDYTKLRTNYPDAPKDYADSFIGDYVTQLENLIESYRLEYGFHEGQDVAVVSLRDDVMNVRVPCEIESENLLANAGQLDRLQAVELDEPGGWRVSGCREDTEGPLPDCVMPKAFHGEETEDLPYEVATLAYDIEFGEDGSYCSGSDTCGFQDGAELAQTLELRPGRYRFSWYEWVPEGAGTRDLWVVRDSMGALASELSGVVDDLGSEEWTRPFVEFDVDSKKLVTVGFRQHQEEVASIRVAAPMLEIVGSSADEVPGVFMNTQAGSVSTWPVCEDTTGELFRSDQRWEYRCMRLCKDGFSAACDSASSALHCYHQAKFTINQRDIESGKMFKSAGFARGNFNYRIDSVALNFVGPGTRDCSDVDAPSSCYGGGFVPYSLVHRGPYFVRNHMGQDFKAELFTGNIEHARGLAAERYLTNPLSGTDRELLSDYLRRELRGRPLDGNFLIRIWEEPGVDFEAIQDVQVVLNYRYWTRFD
jgi:hypothetical protein